MFLSDRDLLWAIQTGRLIINPRPEKIDATSIDLHLGKIDDAKIWDIVQFASDQQDLGKPRPECTWGTTKSASSGPSIPSLRRILILTSITQLCGEAMKSSLDRSGFCFGRLERRLEHQRPMRI